MNQLLDAVQNTLDDVTEILGGERAALEHIAAYTPELALEHLKDCAPSPQHPDIIKDAYGRSMRLISSAVADLQQARYQLLELEAWLEKPAWQSFALDEGWDLFDVGSGGSLKLALERIDEDNKFLSDHAALLHVVGKAVQSQDGPHYDALLHWSVLDRASYLAAMDSVTELLP